MQSQISSQTESLRREKVTATHRPRVRRRPAYDRGIRRSNGVELPPHGLESLTRRAQLGFTVLEQSQRGADDFTGRSAARGDLAVDEGAGLVEDEGRVLPTNALKRRTKNEPRLAGA